MDAFPRSSPSQSMTLTAAPYIIHQDYAAYSEEQHRVWAELVERAFAELEEHAAREYLDGFSIIGLERDRLPNLEAISARLEPRTGWNATPVSGFLPAPAFFEMLAGSPFPYDNLAAQPRITGVHARTGHLSRRFRACAHACARGICRFSRALRARLCFHRRCRSA